MCSLPKKNNMAIFPPRNYVSPWNKYGRKSKLHLSLRKILSEKQNTPQNIVGALFVLLIIERIINQCLTFQTSTFPENIFLSEISFSKTRIIARTCFFLHTLLKNTLFWQFVMKSKCGEFGTELRGSRGSHMEEPGAWSQHLKDEE